MIDEGVGSKRKYEMSKFLAYNYMTLEGQRNDNERRIERMGSCLNKDDYLSIRNLDFAFACDGKTINDDALKMLEDIPIYNYFLRHVTCIPPVYALALVTSIGDIQRFISATKLWAYFGMHNYRVDVDSGKRWFRTRESAVEFVTSVIRINGEFSNIENTSDFDIEVELRLKFCCWGDGYNCEKVAAKSIPKELVNWNVFCRNVCWRIGENIRKGSGFYHGLYSKMLAQKMEQLSNVNLSDIRNAEFNASRHITKLFLIHLVQYWRQHEKLSTKAPLDSKDNIEFPGIPMVYSH